MDRVRDRIWLRGLAIADPNRAQVWSQWSYLPARRSDFRANTKVPVSRDLDLEHMYLGCRLTWRPSCAGLVAIEPFVSY